MARRRTRCAPCVTKGSFACARSWQCRPRRPRRRYLAMTPDDPDIVRRFEQLAALTPDAETTAGALERVRTALVNAPMPRPLFQRRVLMFARIAAVVLLLAGGASLLGWFLSPRADAGLAFAEVQETVQG